MYAYSLQLVTTQYSAAVSLPLIKTPANEWQ